MRWEAAAAFDAFHGHLDSLELQASMLKSGLDPSFYFSPALHLWAFYGQKRMHHFPGLVTPLQFREDKGNGGRFPVTVAWRMA